MLSLRNKVFIAKPHYSYKQKLFNTSSPILQRQIPNKIQQCIRTLTYKTIAQRLREKKKPPALIINLKKKTNQILKKKAFIHNLQKDSRINTFWYKTKINSLLTITLYYNYHWQHIKKGWSHSTHIHNEHFSYIEVALIK